MTTTLFRSCLLLALAASDFTRPDRGQVIYVDARARGADTGTSWQHACQSLQSALKRAAAGDEIWVAQGTYRPTDGDDRSASFALVDGVRILGGFAGSETTAEKRDPLTRPTILSGNVGRPDDDADDSFHVVTADAAIGPTAVLDGFVVERGNARGVKVIGGGGLYLRGSPTVRRSTLRDNSAGMGGAVYVEGGSPLFIDCTFTGNVADIGGGIYTRGGVTALVNAALVVNTAPRGAAVLVASGSLELINATVARNVATRLGGAVWVDGGAALVHNGIVWGNSPVGSPFGGLPPVVAFSDVEGGFPGAGNIEADPGFLDADRGDFRLSPASPAIDAGANALVPPSVATAIDGGPRIVAHPSRGTRVEARVDLGAWEFDGRVSDSPGSGDGENVAGGVDTDGDGEPDATDCRPLDSTLWTVPSPARSFVVGGGASTNLSWSAPLAPGGTLVFYDVLRSTSPSDFSSAVCIYSNQTGTITTDPGSITGARYYLVRAKNACGGNLGTNSALNPRVGAPSCLFGLGESCAIDLDCAGGFCTDGVCCASRCHGECESCNLPGVAGSCDADLAGTDPDNECPAQPPSTCGLTGQCSGARSCQLHPASTLCSSPSCANATQLNVPDACNGVGACVDGGLLSCAPYGCDAAAGACRTSCASNEQCAPGFSCKTSTGQCLANDEASCTTNGDCLNNACCGNICRNLTTDVANCGLCGTACTNPHGTTSCVGGNCSPSCSGPWASCDTDPVNGCETSLTTLTSCGACNVPCSLPNATESCATGSCQIASCDSARSNCDGSHANGCEVLHSTNPNTCGAAEFVGSSCGDSDCGFLCPGTSWTTFATRSARTSRWFRAHIDECSSCDSDLRTRITLSVPAGTDYDLHVYRPCGTLIASSTAGTGATDQVTLLIPDTGASDNSFDYWVEVRYFSGASCSNWSLTFEGREC